MNGNHTVTDKSAARHRKLIKALGADSTNKLRNLLKDSRIHKDEIGFAEQSLADIELAMRLVEELRRDTNRQISERIDRLLAIAMKGMYVCGGIAINSKTLRKHHSKPAILALEESMDIYNQAIRHALEQPPSRALGKKRGTTAMANRALKAANQWLMDHGHKETLTPYKIQKRLERYPDDFPPSDSWQK